MRQHALRHIHSRQKKKKRKEKKKKKKKKAGTTKALVHESPI